jgi:adenylosuccinate synthase
LSEVGTAGLSLRTWGNRMPAITIVGAQWGDEGKGKIVDLLAEEADWVVRFQGGNNAGHTLVVDGSKTTLSLVPSGILRKSTKCLIGAGTVFNPSVLVAEISKLQSAGVTVSPERLIIDRDAHVVLDYHVALDQERERSVKFTRIGTTGRGIGPAYEDRAARIGIRAGELQYPDRLEERVAVLVDDANEQLSSLLGSGRRVDFRGLWERLLHEAQLLTPYLGNGSLLIGEASKQRANILFEGAQGVLLDGVHGTYPYVTSSSTIAGAVCTGVGIGPREVGVVLGVTKAYATRVGEGPFPSEMDAALGDEVRERGNEFGSVTGRPRRCGWFDLVAMKRAKRLSGLDALVLTKLDILSGLRTIRVCSGYTLRGKALDDVPSLAHEFSAVEPQFVELPGWGDLHEVRSWHHLPDSVLGFLRFVESETGLVVALVSIGPERGAVIWRPGFERKLFSGLLPLGGNDMV